MYPGFCRVVLDNNKIVCLFCGFIMWPVWISCSPFGTRLWTAFCRYFSSSLPIIMHYELLLFFPLTSQPILRIIHVKPPDSPDSTIVTVCANKSSNSLGVLTHVLTRCRCLFYLWMMCLDLFYTKLGCFKLSCFRLNTVLPQNGVIQIL